MMLACVRSNPGFLVVDFPLRDDLGDGGAYTREAS